MTDKPSQGQSVNFLRCLFSQIPPTPARSADCWNVRYSQESATLPVYASNTGSPVCGLPESLPVWWCWRHRGTPRSVSWWCWRMSAGQSSDWKSPPSNSLGSPLNKIKVKFYFTGIVQVFFIHCKNSLFIVRKLTKEIWNKYKNFLFFNYFVKIVL